jgi:hypothetical protein
MRACKEKEKAVPSRERRTSSGCKKRSEVRAGPFTTRNFVASVVGDAAEVIEKFTKYIEMIVTAIGLELIEGHYEIESVHQWPPNSSLKRASSRTKSSKRRLAAASSRSANQVSALAENAHNAGRDAGDRHAR